MSIRSETFIQNFSGLVPLGGNLDLFTIVIPAKAVFRAISFGNYCGTFLAWGFVYWEFLHDGYPLYPYQRVLDQIGFGTGRQNVQGVDIEGGHEFRIRAYNPTAANCNMGISLEYVLEYPEQ